MDFLKILKSFEEFVYEALSWLVLLPKTLARIIVQPRRMTNYAALELRSTQDERFNDAISPPLLLILCVLLAHLIDLGIRTQTPNPSGSLADVVLSSEQNLLLYRTMAFGFWALAGAVYFLVRKKVPVSRESLRVPFYEQCYLVAPFALALSVSTSFLLVESYWTLPGLCLAAFGFIWFLIAQIDWIRRRANLSLWRAVVAAFCILVIGSIANALLARALVSTRVDSEPAAIKAE